MAREQEFLYVSARVKALETKLLGRNTIDRILDAQDLDEAIKLLSDTEYGGDLAELSNIYDFEEVLENSMIRTLKVLRESFKEHKYLRFFTLKHDYHNLKVVVKSRILGGDIKGAFSKLGEVSPEELSKLSEEGGDNVPEGLREAYSKAVEAYEESKDPQQVDTVLDKFLFGDMAKIVAELRDPFLKEYFTALADITNIKAIARLMWMKADGRVAERALVEGGALPLELLRSMFQGSVQGISEALANTPYFQLGNDIVLCRQESEASPSDFEKRADDFLLGIARRGLYKPFGPEVVIGYMAARENELKLLRLLLVGKINDISSDMIRERLRDVYV